MSPVTLSAEISREVLRILQPLRETGNTRPLSLKTQNEILFALTDLVTRSVQVPPNIYKPLLLALSNSKKNDLCQKYLSDLMAQVSLGGAAIGQAGNILEQINVQVETSGRRRYVELNYPEQDRLAFTEINAICQARYGRNAIRPDSLLMECPIYRFANSFILNFENPYPNGATRHEHEEFLQNRTQLPANPFPIAMAAAALCAEGKNLFAFQGRQYVIRTDLVETQKNHLIGGLCILDNSVSEVDCSPFDNHRASLFIAAGTMNTYTDFSPYRGNRFSTTDDDLSRQRLLSLYVNSMSGVLLGNILGAKDWI